MNLESAILKEHSKANSDRIAAQVCKSIPLFKELLKLYFANEKIIAQRAAWIVSIVALRKPEFFDAEIPKICKFILRTDLHDALIRNGAKALELIEIPDKHLAIVADTCFKILLDPTQKVAPKCYCLTALTKICIRIPEFKNELQLVIESQLPYSTAAFSARIRQTQKILKRKTSS